MKYFKKVVGIFAATVLLAMNLPLNAFAAVDFGNSSEEFINTQMSAQYGQTDARKMLDYINAFRIGKGDGNHADHPHSALDHDDKTWVDYPDLPPLQYDYELEKVAMQRAAEIALTFSHTRPNASDALSSAFPDRFYAGSLGENIAAGHDCAWFTFLQWREDDCLFNGQGHRRNMLDPSFVSVGIGHVEFMGQHYWVQEFSSLAPQSPKTDALDADADVDVQIKTDLIAPDSTAIYPDTKQIELIVGTSIPAPRVTLSFLMTDTWPESERHVTVPADWISDDENIAVSANGQLTGIKAGISSISANVYGEQITLAVNVVCEHQASADWSFDAAEHWHKCTFCEELLDKAPHQWSAWENVKMPSCTESGSQTHHCSVCGYTVTEEIPTAGHNWDTVFYSFAPDGSACSAERICKNDASHHETASATVSAQRSKEPACTEKGETTYTALFTEKWALPQTLIVADIPILGHSPIHHTAIPATCAENGTVEYWSCKRCNKNFADADCKTEITDLTVDSLEHAWSAWKISDEPTCTENGTGTRICQSCGKTETQEIEALKHQPVHVGELNPTAKKEGYIEHWHCERCDRNFSDAECKTLLNDIVLPPIPAKPEKPSFDWLSVRSAILEVKEGSSYQRDVGNEIAVPYFIWQAFYDRNVTIMLVHCGDKYVFNGLDLAKTGFDPDNSHNLTDLTSYIGRTYNKDPDSSSAAKPVVPPESETNSSEIPSSESSKTDIPSSSQAASSDSESEAQTISESKEEISSASSEPDVIETDAPSDKSEEKSSGFAWWIWLLVGVAVLLIILVLIIIFSRRR